MCILFFKAQENPKADEFALILINNRDEMFNRPTQLSHFWTECPDIIGGRDTTPGKEGGTWLAMSKRGKIGVLLNVLQPHWEEIPHAKGRGNLVSDFMRSNESSKTYLDKIAVERQLYNSFNLITIEARFPFDNFVIGHYHNITDDPPQFLSPGFHGVGNCLPDRLWKKIPYGLEKFKNICHQYPRVGAKEQLISNLIGLLNDRTKHFPDPYLESQGQGKGNNFLESLSGIYVDIANVNYGTRTNTVILIDGAGNVDYVERTMEQSVNFQDPQWTTQHHQFTLNTA